MSIFDPITYLLENRGTMINVDDLYDNCVDLLALEVSLHGLIQDAQAAGLQSKALEEVIELLDPDKDYLEDAQ